MRRTGILLAAAAAVLSAHWSLQVSSTVERLENGNTLVADAGSVAQRHGCVLEVDSLGRLVWAYVRNDVTWLHSARRTEDGTTLMAATDRDRVQEVDAEGDSVWAYQFGLDYPNDAYRLEGGNTLITDRDHSRVIEVDPGGQVVWQYTQLFHPHNGSRLRNGNTLICDSNNNKVVEVDSAGNVVWEKSGGLLWPRGAQRLENGNTLITDSQHRRVIEVDSSGAIVWQYASLVLPFTARRLANRNTLISDSRLGGNSAVLEVTREGNVVWRYPWTVDVVVDTFRVRNPSSGCSLYAHIHRPAYASADSTVPGVVLVPGGSGDGHGFDSTGMADNIATEGFAVLHFDPDGRGLSDSFPEDYDGHVHQDGLLACLRHLAAQDYVDTVNLGIMSWSYGVTMASGMMARHRDSARVKFLLDWEGPSDRSQTCADSGGHVPVPADSEEFWVEREAARFMTGIRSAYLRMQTEVDHNPDITDNRHCIALIDSATDFIHGGSGTSPWTRVNDSTMNGVNEVYTVAEPPEWIPETEQPHAGLRQLIYLHELVALDLQVGVESPSRGRFGRPVRVLGNPVGPGEPVRANGPPGRRLLVRDRTGRRVGACREGRAGRYAWDRRLPGGGAAPAGCYWLCPDGGGGAAKVVLTR